MAFCMKHMDNRFVLDRDISVDARELIAREVVGNILIHRDYSNAFPAKLIIEKDVLRTENWSKSRFNGPLSIENFSPYPKNPLIASFFVNIGRADKLGSGMRNIYKYTRLYSHSDPVLSEGDIFEIRIPLNETNVKPNEANVNPIESNMNPIESNTNPIKKDSISEKNINEAVIEIIKKDPKITQRKLPGLLGVSRSTIQRVMRELTEQGRIERIGGTRGYWKIRE